MLSGMLRSTGTLERKSITKDSSGGEVATYSTVTADIPCDIQSTSATIQFHYQQRHLHVSHRIYFASDVAARETDRFVVGSRVFKVMGYTPPGTNYTDWPAVIDCQEEP